jgi:uncharacterized membrane protein YidH (DUF202 family)
VIPDEGLQHERTALAWERTAIAMMVAGVVAARYLAQSLHVVFAIVGLAQVVVGAALLIWSGKHYDETRGPVRPDESPLHPTAARLVGLTTIAFTAAAAVLAISITLD